MGFWDKVKRFFGGGGALQPDPSAPTAAPPSTPTPSTPAPAPAHTAPAPPAARTAPAPTSTDDSARFRNPAILGLSAAELRKRALRINPYQTPWIGRVDTIPPQSDERTAIIDRGLILRGLLTAAQIEEIHRVGDLWLAHHDAMRLAAAAGAASGEAAVAAERARRAEAKRAKQAAAAARAAARAAAVAARRATDIIFVGRGVSAGLADRRSHVEQLAAAGLPVLAAPADLAAALGLTVPRLRWLCFHADAPAKTHYTYFTIPKRSGGTRKLAAPHRQLAAAQRWIFDQILAKLPITDAAHGFVPGRSTVTNARPHVGQRIVINLDLADFFPSITFPRVRGLFASLGYSPAIATLLAMLTTEAPRVEVEFAGRTHYVATGPRALPQGACTSPTLANLVARKLDRRLGGATRKLGWTYTRYADDLTFSAPAAGSAQVALIFARVRAIVTAEGFAVNEAKGRVQRGGRHTVTGLVVNDRLAVPREQVRRVRAILHGARTTGLAAQNRAGHPDFRAWLQGTIAYIHMVDPARGAAFQAQLDALS
ncbi:MAG: RNA-directed DNA polymerase [Myxococcales bacterium]|nr:RNA-directed DNA polymerase [Myxococcales bacterium]MBK7192384.1 RNA-directed DNA polymerase [Myxococcales bacterium]